MQKIYSNGGIIKQFCNIYIFNLLTIWIWKYNLLFKAMGSTYKDNYENVIKFNTIQNGIITGLVRIREDGKDYYGHFNGKYNNVE